MELEVDLKLQGELSKESLEQKMKFEQLISKQDKERNDQKEKKKFIDENFNDPREKMLYIQRQFNEQYDGDFDPLFDEYKEIKQFFINSNHALTTYDKYKYKEQLESVENTLFQLKDIVRPRKRFQFTNRERTKKTQQVENKSDKINQKTGKKMNTYLHLKDYSEKIPGFINLTDTKLSPLRSELQMTWKLENLSNCEIKLDTFFDAIFIKNVKNSKIYVGPVKSSVFIDQCENCELVVAGHQIRIHNSNSCQFIIYSTSKCIIENCTKVVFSPYLYTYPEIKNDFKAAGFENKSNLWNQVQDFNWLKQEKSPNFELIE